MRQAGRMPPQPLRYAFITWPPWPCRGCARATADAAGGEARGGGRFHPVSAQPLEHPVQVVSGQRWPRAARSRAAGLSGTSERSSNASCGPGACVSHLPTQHHARRALPTHFPLPRAKPRNKTCAQHARPPTWTAAPLRSGESEKALQLAFDAARAMAPGGELMACLLYTSRRG